MASVGGIKVNNNFILFNNSIGQPQANQQLDQLVKDYIVTTSSEVRVVLNDINEKCHDVMLKALTTYGEKTSEDVSQSANIFLDEMSKKYSRKKK